MSKARPKSYCMYYIRTFLGDAGCCIHIYPQQKWEYRVNGDKVILDRKGISLEIPKTDFEKQWKVVE